MTEPFAGHSVHPVPRARRLRAAAFALALAGGGAAFFAIQSESAIPSEEVREAQWLPVQAQTLENRLGLAGRVEAAARLTVTAPFEGSIRQVAAPAGQRVEAGQVLLSLETAQLDVQRRQALAELLKARRTVAEMRNWQHGAEVARARRAVAQAEMSLNDVETRLADTRRLFERGIVARMEVDALEQQSKSQKLDLAASQAELRAAQERGQGENREIAEMEQANAQARYDALAAQWQQREVRAPFAGIVLPRPRSEGTGDAAPIQPGARVTPGMPLFDLARLDTLRAVASVEEADLYQLRVGMPVEIVGDGFKGLALRGYITALGAQGVSADRYRGGTAYEVVIAIDPLTPEQQQRVRLGMSAQASIVTYRTEHGFALPAEALRRDDDGPFVVWRRNMDAPPKRIRVQTGRAVPEGVEVFGIEPGEVALPGTADQIAAKAAVQ
ncbi:MAG: HlyD family efflux transporter periplasmic adaptor subunit [Azoarcus sp.]|jgi:multidrug resistance efflux pump|nr:HlyD family efflux transporter periplasmic adaptor subunit [Azoarcus sp.]